MTTSCPAEVTRIYLFLDHMPHLQQKQRTEQVTK